jgi:hypothetical protein
MKAGTVREYIHRDMELQLFIVIIGHYKLLLNYKKW